MLSEDLQSLLSSLRQRIRRYVVLDSLLAIAAVILAAFWIGLAIDYLPITVGGSEMPRSARAVLMLIVATLVAVILITMLLARLAKPLPDESLALLVERVHPKLGGRLITAVQLMRAGRSGDAHSHDLLQLVHLQAREQVDEVDPGRVFRTEPLAQKAMIAGPLLLLLIVFAVLSPGALAHAAARLTLFSDARWPRKAKLEIVGVDLPRVTASATDDLVPDRFEFQERRLRLPKGSKGSLRIRAHAEEGHVVPSVCTLYYETEDGTRGQTNLRRVGRKRDGFQAFVLDGPPISNLSESFSFSIRGADDRLVDYRIDAIEPPTITEMTVRVRYPDYLRDAGDLEFDSELPYQAGLRIREGSGITFDIESSVPLGNVDAVIDSEGVVTPIENLEFLDSRSRARFQISSFRKPTSIRLVPSDESGISAQSPFRYFLGAVIDEPPSVTLRLNGIQSAVTAVARIPVTCEAYDDYGLEELNTIVVRTANNERQEDQASHGIGMIADRNGITSEVIDLRSWVNSGLIPSIEPGNTLSIFAQAKDGYDLDKAHTTVSEIVRLQVVTEAELLKFLEKRELGLRTRLEQTLTEMQGLRERLSRFKADRFELPTGERADAPAERNRELQIMRLGVEQSALQANKTTEELSSIAELVDDIVVELINNRVDSADRRERLGAGVRDPLRRVVDEEMSLLKLQISEIESVVEAPPKAIAATETALAKADAVILALNAVLEKMLYLESYNEILDLYRSLIEEQAKLKTDTEKERKRAVLRLLE